VALHATSCDTIAPVKAFLPWLAVLGLVIALNALRLRPLAVVVSIAWLAWCVYTWVRPRSDR
jgi:hypothetical protein